MANSLMQQAQQFKLMVEQVKQQSLAAKDQAVHSMKTQMEKVYIFYVWPAQNLI